MSSFPKRRVAFFVSSNIHKFNEIRRVLSEYGVATALIKRKALEIQNDSIERIAETSATESAKRCNLPIFVEDAGLFIEALKGFPGPYSSYAYETIGAKGILRLMENVESREASFHSAVAFCSPNESPKCFHGKADGKISFEERGAAGFGFDPVFEPSSGGGKTFAQMTTEEKNKFSHRARAMRKFARWYTSGSTARYSE